MADTEKLIKLAQLQRYNDNLQTEISGIESALDKKISDEETRAKAAEEANAAAAKAAQDDVDALETYVGTFTSETATDVIGYVDEKVAGATGDASKVAQDLADYKTSNDAAVAANKKAIEDEADTARAAEEALTNLIGEIEEGSTVAAEIAKAEKAAKDYTDEKVGDLGSVLNFKGIVDTEADLPTEGVRQGDVYNVKTTARGTSAEFVYITDKGWEELGDVLDLSAYDTRTVEEEKIATAKSEAIQAAKDYADGLDSAMDARMDVVEAAIGEGGSVQSQIDASIAKLDYTDDVEGDFVTSVTEEDGVISIQKSKFVYATDEEIDAMFADETE